MKKYLPLLALLLATACATPPKDHKVAVCHKGKTLYVDQSARDAHIKHGDYGHACYGGDRHDEDDDRKGKGKAKGKEKKGQGDQDD